MLVQTTITTIKSTTLLGADFQITTIEQTVSAFCDCCPNQTIGSEEALKQQGWSLSSNCQFCPECND
jgi:hypothetical protein